MVGHLLTFFAYNNINISSYLRCNVQCCVVLKTIKKWHELHVWIFHDFFECMVAFKMFTSMKWNETELFGEYEYYTLWTQCTISRRILTHVWIFYLLGKCIPRPTVLLKKFTPVKRNKKQLSKSALWSKIYDRCIVNAYEKMVTEPWC